MPQHLIVLTDSDKPIVFVNTHDAVDTIADALDKEPVAYNRLWQVFSFNAAATPLPNTFGGLQLRTERTQGNKTAFEIHLQKALYYANVHGNTSEQIAEAITRLHQAFQVARAREEVLAQPAAHLQPPNTTGS